jgi:hypothetical protein
LGTVNAGPTAFADALRDLGYFARRWPHSIDNVIGGRYPPEHASEVILEGAPGIKSVVSFSSSD